MKNHILIISISLISIVIIIAFWQYVFTIYEVRSKINKTSLKAGSEEIVEVNVFPVNALGKKVPFREIDAVFYVSEGSLLIEIVEENFRKNTFSFRIKDNPGKVSIKILTDFSLFPIIQEFKVLPDK